MSKSRFFSDKKFCAREILLPAVVFGLLGWLFWDWCAAILIGIGVLGVAVMRVKYMEFLSQASFTYNHVYWAINLNNIRIGRVPESWLARAKLKALRDPHVYADQAFEFVTYCLRIIKALICLIPVLLFWLVVGIEIMSPGSMQSVCAAYMKANPALIIDSIVEISEIIGVISVVCIGMAVIYGTGFGFVDCFGLAMEKDLRFQYDIAAGGEISLDREPYYLHDSQPEPNSPPVGFSRGVVLVLASVVVAFAVLLFNLALAPIPSLPEGVAAAPINYGENPRLPTREMLEFDVVPRSAAGASPAAQKSGVVSEQK